MSIKLKCFVNFGFGFVSGDGRSSEEVQTEVNQLKMQVQQRKKEVEDLKTALEEKVEEKMKESQDKTKELEALKAALKGKEEEIAKKDKELEEVKSELDDLNKCLEEKSREADESMDKYCNLMVQVHKLEEANDALATRLEHITNSRRANEANTQSSSTDGTHRRRSARKSSSKHQEEKMDENMAPQTPQRSPPGSSSGKRGHRDISDKDSAWEALHNLTKKIKANVVTTPKLRTEQEDEEFRPEGLPELVKRGLCWVVMYCNA